MSASRSAASLGVVVDLTGRAGGMTLGTAQTSIGFNIVQNKFFA
jgi:hypothetical protein